MHSHSHDSTSNHPPVSVTGGGILQVSPLTEQPAQWLWWWHLKKDFQNWSTTPPEVPQSSFCMMSKGIFKPLVESNYKLYARATNKQCNSATRTKWSKVIHLSQHGLWIYFHLHLQANCDSLYPIYPLHVLNGHSNKWCSCINRTAYSKERWRWNDLERCKWVLSAAIFLEELKPRIKEKN